MQNIELKRKEEIPCKHCGTPIRVSDKWIRRGLMCPTCYQKSKDEAYKAMLAVEIRKIQRRKKK